jgi:hypothetical protein
VVLLAFATGNDVADNSRILKQVDYDPYYIYQGNKLVLDDQQTRENYFSMEQSFLRQLVFRWKIDSLRVFQIIHHAKDRFLKWWLLQNFGKEAHAPDKGEEAGISDTIYREPTTEIWKEAWRVTEGVLLLMRDEVARKGAQFFVVTLTNGVQVDPDVSHRIGFAKWLGVSHLFYPEHRLQGFCQSHHIPILLLGPYFQKYATQNQVFLHGFGKTLGAGHWNQKGHRLAGETIAKWLCPQIQ